MEVDLLGSLSFMFFCDSARLAVRSAFSLARMMRKLLRSFSRWSLSRKRRFSSSSRR